MNSVPNLVPTIQRADRPRAQLLRHVRVPRTAGLPESGNCLLGPQLQGDARARRELYRVVPILRDDT